jgi:hypothetical protein
MYMYFLYSLGERMIASGSTYYLYTMTEGQHMKQIVKNNHHVLAPGVYTDEEHGILTKIEKEGYSALMDYIISTLQSSASLSPSRPDLSYYVKYVVSVLSLWINL